MALNQAELEQCKYWLGYGNLTALARPFFDIAVVFEDVVQKTLDTTWAEGYVRNTILANLLATDVQIQNQTVLLSQATELVDEVKIDAEKELRVLQRLSDYWINRLSYALKVPRVQMSTSVGNTIELM